MNGPELNTLIGNRIRELRKERNWSQEKLSEEAGIDSNQVSRHEQGKMNFMMHHVYRYSHALSVPILDIVPDAWEFEELEG